MSSGQNQIKIILSDKVTRAAKFLEIKLEEDMTYADLLKIVGEKEGINTSQHCFYRKVFNKMERINEQDIALSNEITGPINLKSVPFSIKILHLGISKMIDIEVKDRPEDIRKKFSAVSNKRFGTNIPLSFNGKKINENNDMEEAGVIDIVSQKKSSKDLAIEGAIEISVEDPDVELQKMAIVYPFETVEELKKRFCSLVNRNYIDNSTISFNAKILESYDTLNSVNIKHNDNLIYKSAPYKIRIKDDSTEEQFDFESDLDFDKDLFEVEDHWTVKKIREKFIEQSKPISDRDRFLFKDTVVDEDLKLFRLRLEEGSILKIQRAEIEAFNLYFCADCGHELKLKPKDPVKCKQCFFRIVYKKRTPRVCLYDCR